MRRARREYPGSTREVFLKGGDRWQVSYFADTKPGTPRKEIAQVLIDDGTARVLEAWTDYQVPWSMARGYPGAFGRIVNAPWVWIPLAVLFVAPFLRRPWRMLHLDLLVAERVLGLDGVLQRGADRRVGAARLSAARLPARADAVDRPAPRRGGARAGAPAAARCSCR